MIEFVKRLKREQIKDFFEGVGKLEAIKPSASEGMIDIVFREDNGKKFWYSISDDFISAYGFYKTSEDWKFYLNSIFGKEYIEEYAEEPVPNNFIKELSIEDVRDILSLGNIVACNIEEKEAFRIGTRRFKIKIEVPTKNDVEIIIGPHINYCMGIPFLTEKMFMQFFSKKFGIDFINYYIDIEKKIELAKVEAYRDKCNKRVLDKLNYMVKIMENQSLTNSGHTNNIIRACMHITADCKSLQRCIDDTILLLFL